MNNNTSKKQRKQIASFEAREIHPLVAQWLTDNRYTYQHEYKMPDYGRVDFYATHEDGHILLVEAKGAYLDKVITQLKGYSVQFPDARLAIASPQELITLRVEKIAEKYNINIIALDIEIDKTPNPYQRDPFAAKTIDLIINTSRIIQEPREVAGMVLKYHEEKETSPFLDLFIFYLVTLQVSPDVYSDTAVENAQNVYTDAATEAFFKITDEFTYSEESGAVKLYQSMILNAKGFMSLPMIAGGVSYETLRGRFFGL